MRALGLEDRAILHPLLGELRPQQSEFTFTNLFIWRDAHQLRVCRAGEAVLIFSWRADPEDSFLFPPLGAGADRTVVRAALEHMAAEDEFAIQSDRAQWDYVYPVQDLIELRGNRYHGKRNHLEQFTQRYQFSYHGLAAELVPACQELQDRWCDEKHCDLVATLHSESRAVKEALEEFETLGITGGCIVVEGKVEAFALGELLNPETVVIHIEKANAAFHGLYQAVNQQFLEQAWRRVPYVNREQDLGLAGLRKAKESYHPHHMVEKFEVRLK
jgi:hypothetical protein